MKIKSLKFIFYQKYDKSGLKAFLFSCENMWNRKNEHNQMFAMIFSYFFGFSAIYFNYPVQHYQLVSVKLFNVIL